MLTMAKKPVRTKKSKGSTPASKPEQNGTVKKEKIDRVGELLAASRAVKYLKSDDRVYCAVKDCGKKLEKGRTHYCKAHDVWPT
jgi:hypothetical protein